MFYTDDPIADFHRYDAEQQRMLDRLPKCSECGEPIQDEFCYEVNDELVCDKCMNTYHRKSVDDFIE